LPLGTEDEFELGEKKQLSDLMRCELYMTGTWRIRNQKLSCLNEPAERSTVR